MGLVRSFALVRGAPLPAPGSFKERILAEAIIREKNEKWTMVTLFARLISKGLGVDTEYVNFLLDKYKEELYQLRYNFKYKSVESRLLQKRLQEELEQDRMFQRLEAMSAPDPKESSSDG